jgi:PhnB protein
LLPSTLRKSHEGPVHLTRLTVELVGVIVGRAIGRCEMGQQTGAVTPIPPHLRTVTPRLVVRDGVGALEFYRRAFGAEAVGDVFQGPNGQVIHAEMRIGDSVVMVTEDTADGAPAVAPESNGGAVTAIMATYWEDVEAAWQRAVEAGAEVIYPLADQFYGERGGRLRDPFGQQWMLSQQIESLSAEEVRRRARDQ